MQCQTRILLNPSQTPILVHWQFTTELTLKVCFGKKSVQQCVRIKKHPCLLMSSSDAILPFFGVYTLNEADKHWFERTQNLTLLTWMSQEVSKWLVNGI